MSNILNTIYYRKDNIGYIPYLSEDINHGFSWGRNSGNMSFSYGEKEEVRARIESFLAELSMNTLANSIFTLPSHGESIIDISQDFLNTLPVQNGYRTIDCDAFFTRIRDMPLLVTPADCTISILKAVDQAGNPILGLVHAGRKGLDLRLPEKAIHHMLAKYGCARESIKIGIPPFITIKNHFIRQLSELSNPNQWEEFYQQRNSLIYLYIANSQTQ